MDKNIARPYRISSDFGDVSKRTAVDLPSQFRPFRPNFVHSFSSFGEFGGSRLRLSSVGLPKLPLIDMLETPQNFEAFNV
jgi:hypothetical protein